MRIAVLLAIVLPLLWSVPLRANSNDMRNSAEATHAVDPVQTNCVQLKDLKMVNTTITSAVSVPAGPFQIPLADNHHLSVDLPSFCRVRGVIRPTRDSHIQFEVWMPESGWNGKFEQIGNGGYAGSIAYGFMYPQLQRGYAIASTDDGHTAAADGSWTDQSWALGHPEKIIDFGYRAVHETSRKAKETIQAFYGKPAAYSFFNGCSDGGREALMEAQRFPTDFNGIIAGAPANDWTHLMAGFVWVEQALLDDPASYIPENKLPALQAASLAACDALDGVRDGLVEDPQRCHFDPAVIECKGADGPECLTEAQVQAARKIYAGPRNPRTGKQIYPGYAPGAEANPADWPIWIIGKLPKGGNILTTGNPFYAYMVFDNPHWNFRSFDFDKDIEIADRKMAPILNSTNPDLQPFKAHGGKLIQYHGWADAGIPPLSSINYYRSVVRRMGGLEKTRNFYRLFMVPGLGHCVGGPGPTTFGAIIQAHAVHPNAENDIVDALVRWVEQGVAPDKIIATKFKDDDPKKPVSMTRPLCPYPEHAKYKGTGSTNDAANFVCK